MSDHVLESRFWVAQPRPQVFAFFNDPANVARLSPPSLRFELLTPRPFVMAAGAVIDYRIRWLGLRLSGRAFIREYDPPVRFVDVQLWGPYRRWEHRHLFLEESGGTWVEDRVTYALPLGPLGRLAHAVVVRRQLARLWEYRRQKLAERFGPARPELTRAVRNG
jgi:ligand-binding SRPBCC domain-containing protein